MEFPFFVHKRVLPTEASLYYLSPLVLSGIVGIIDPKNHHDGRFYQRTKSHLPLSFAFRINL